jgi:hypothetical protein
MEIWKLNAIYKPRLIVFGRSWLEFGNRRRSAVFDGIWARLLRWKARGSGIKKIILNKETVINNG